MLGPDLELERDTLVALCGAEFEADMPLNRPVLLAAGTRLAIGRAARGARAYLAVAGGIAVEPVLGSRSTYLPGGFGGLGGRTLRARRLCLPLHRGFRDAFTRRFGRLKRKSGNTVRWSAPPLTLPEREPIVLHVLDGQHFASFDVASQRAFFDAVWKIAPESNRMGFRLAGPALARAEDDEILSGPDLPGHGAGAGERHADRADGRSPDDRRLSEDRRDRLRRRGAPRAARAGRHGALRALHARHGGGAAPRTACERLETALRGIAWEYGKLKTIDINCDMGESYGAWKMGADAEVMPFITLGEHRLRLPRRRPGDDPQDGARSRSTTASPIGAHPSLPDLQGFGRRAMKISPQDMYDLVVYQAGAVEALRARRRRAPAPRQVPRRALQHGGERRGLSEAMVRAVKDLGGGVMLYALSKPHE